MMKKYEYRVCQVQAACVTFVNGAWQGLSLASEASRADDPLEGCPKLWDYLNQAGAEGWALVASSPHHPEQAAQETLYLRKELYG